MNILVCCSSGMSSSILVNKMRDSVKDKQEYDIKIGAVSINEVKSYINQTDVLIIAPQIDYYYESMVALAKTKDIKVYKLNESQYGMLDVDVLMDEIINEEFKSTDTNKTLPKKIAAFISTNRTLKSISSSFMELFAITTVGSIFSLLTMLPFKPYLDFIHKTKIFDLLNLPVNATIDLISLYLAFLIAFNYFKEVDLDPLVGGLSSLILFLMASTHLNNGLQLEYLGYRGLFTAIVVSIISSQVLVFIMKPKLEYTKVDFKNRLLLENQLYVVLVVFIMIVCIYFVNVYFDTTFTEYFYIQSQKHLSVFLRNNVFSSVFLLLLLNLFWFFGIHGGKIVNSISDPFYIGYSLENLTAFQNQQPLPNLITKEFQRMFISGGVGGSLSLVILMLLFSKSEQYKRLGKLSLPTTLFYINEPLLFGLPIIMNPLFFIPLVFITPTLGLITYYAMRIGLIPPPRGVPLPWTTPPFVYGLLQGSLRMGLWQVFMVFVGAILWYPFFKKGDQKAYLLENKSLTKL